MKYIKIKASLSKLFIPVHMFLREQETRFGKWLCRKYGNWDEYIRNYSPTKKINVRTVDVMPETRWFDTDTRMVSTSSMYSFSYPEAQPSHRSLMTENLWKVPGIVSMEIRAYEITIRIGKMFSWDDIQPKVLGIIERYASETNL